eukprot:scaffold255872_cov19-Tisochrysis_lutea.AAC.1
MAAAAMKEGQKGAEGQAKSRRKGGRGGCEGCTGCVWRVCGSSTRRGERAKKWGERRGKEG